MRSALAAVLCAAAVFPGGAAIAEAQSPSPSPSPAYLARAREILAGFDRERTLAQIRDLYEEAKASGERVPADLWAWVRQDLDRAGAWEYRVVKGEKDPAALEAQLNALGRDRWECVTLRETGRAEPTLVLKRPVKSHLGQLNLRDILRVLPDRN